MSEENKSHSNYNFIKQRMSEKSKGFWKVKAISILTKRLQKKYNAKDFIYLKTLSKPKYIIPPFITFRHMINKQLYDDLSNENIGGMSANNFFITGQTTKELERDINSDRKKSILKKIFGNFNYEPLLYNEYQIFSLERERRILPRKFNDVLKDAIAMMEYKKYIRKMQNMKDQISMTKLYNSKYEYIIKNKKSMTTLSRKNLSASELNYNSNSIKEENSFNDIKISKPMYQHKLNQSKSTIFDKVKNLRGKLKINRKKFKV